jgi:hypothetical protein
VRLAVGTSVGSYEIVAPLAVGGMGEVYRAHDGRLGRDVAIKVLPAALASDPEALARFGREARAVAALSHPNILVIHDFGSENGLAYAVLELVDGETLRSKLDGAALPPRKAVDVVVQIAHALAAAHDKGIVHRDLKPENVFVTRDGRVKLLDFGLAKMADASRLTTSAETRAQLQTQGGAVLGTVGYMSPEQVRGLPADHRSDIFSCGVLLYEMLAGRRPFAGNSAVETMNAILKDQPEPVIVNDGAVGPTLRRITEHCLEKQPEERFQSARDLAFDLEALRTASDQGGAAPAGARRPRRISPAAAAALAIVALGAGLWGGRVLPRRGTDAPDTPVFRRLTYEKGTIWNGRFGPQGQVLYAAAWDGRPIEVFVSRTDRAGSSRLDLPDASLLAISRAGELAVSLDHVFEGWMGEGTLARVPLFGTGPRPVAEHVREADWAPDGKELAIVRRVNGRERLEFPIGTTLYETGGYISQIRVAKDGQRIAFADHPVYADDNGDVTVVDRSGTRATLARGLHGLRGIAWSPDGSEVWFTAQNSPQAGVSMRAASLHGGMRTVLSLPTDWRILDVADDGRLLMASEIVARHIELRREREAPQALGGSFEQAIATVISADGQSVLITDQGGYAGTSYATYLRRADGAAPVRLGEGQALAFSPDGRDVLSLVNGPPARLLLLPTGAGQPRELPNPEGLTISVAGFLPDGRRIALLAAKGTAALRGYVQDIASGRLQPFTGDGVHAPAFSALPIAPDGAGVWLIGADGRPALFPIAGGAPRPLPGVEPGDNLVMWAPDGKVLYVSSVTRGVQHIHRVELPAGVRTRWKAVAASQPAGVRLSQALMTPDGKTELHSYSQLLTSLYVVDGVPARR